MPKQFFRRSRSKYGSKPVIVDGTKFHSKREAKRYTQLKQLQAAGKINGLRMQVRYKIIIETVYVADFVYFDSGKNCEVVEDVKGFRTREYVRKKRLMKKQHNIEVIET
jgi:hypothetical protein